MVQIWPFKFQTVLSFFKICILLMLFFYCQKILASQEAMVIVERAVIFSDREMTSPVGYVSRGKKIKVGEIPRNKAQVYPVIVSGKIAYIRVADVTTEKESMDSSRLTAERFQRTANQGHGSKFVASYYSFLSAATLNPAPGALKDGDLLAWHGVSLMGEAKIQKKFDLQIIANYMFANEGEEKFQVFEFGAGGAIRLLEFRKFLLRLNAQLLSVPFSSYELGSLFRVRSYGYTVGAGVSGTIFFDENWGMELMGGLYRTSLFSFDAPAPYQDFDATFAGARLGIGLNYSY